MQRFLHAQRLVVMLLGAALVVALGIGLWPVEANVFGDASYSCGSGFIHSSGSWNRDSRLSQFERSATDTATGTPKTVCPDKVDSRRDLALLVLAFGLGFAIIAQIVFERPRARNFRSTMWVNRPRVTAARKPVARPRREDSAAKKLAP